MYSKVNQQVTFDHYADLRQCLVILFDESDIEYYRISYFIFEILQFSLSQIEYPLGGSSKKGSHVYFLLIVAMILLL